MSILFKLLSLINKKCLSCNNTPGKVYQCGACNPGYYLPSDASDLEKKACFKCEEGCETCDGTKENKICSKCSENYIFFEENTPEEVVDKALAYKPIIL